MKNKENGQKTEKQKPRVWLGYTLMIGVLTLLMAGFVGIRSYYKYIEYLEIGYQYSQIYMTRFCTKLIFQLLSFGAVFLLLAVNALVLRKAVYRDNADLRVIRSKRLMILLTIPVALIISYIVSGKLYESFLAFRNVTWFGETDPMFGWDIGYYIFTRPFYMALVDAVKGVLLFAIVTTLLFYVLLQLRGGVSELKKLFQNKYIFIHCFINLMLFIIFTALAYKFNIEGLLYGSFCSVAGAGATAMNIWYLYYKIAPFLLIAIVPVSIYFLMKARYRNAAVTLGVFPAVWVLAVLCAVVHQAAFVDANELTAENKYLSYNIALTRRAYGLDQFHENIYELKNNLTNRDLATYSDVLEQVNLLSTDEALENIAAQQPVGDYEKFTDADFGIYTIDGERTTVAVTARELDSKALGDSSDAYTNASLKYTHGIGPVMAQTNMFDSRGNLVLRIKDTPPISDFGMEQVSEPRIYYGEHTDQTAFVRTLYTEADYQSKEGGGSYSYTGFGGIQMTWFNRLAMAFGGGDFRQLMSGYIDSGSRALVNRNVMERVSKLAPFFMYDADPYLVLTDSGHLKWVIDAYAVTDKYPYATPMGGINYIRSCAKVVVDAYNGTVTFYATDAENPFVQTYSKMYPTLFSKEELPEDIRAHLRYPQDLFRIQADMYRKYHVTDVDMFYNATQEWETAKTKTPMTPYYTMTRMGNELQMNLTTAFTPYKSNTLCALMLAGSDVNNYGTVTVYHINENDSNKAYGLSQAENLMNGSEQIAAQMKELSRNGASVTRGQLMVVPIKSTLFYAQNVYITEGDEHPRVRGVLVCYDGHTVFADDLKSALRILLSDDKRNEEYQTSATVRDAENTEEELTDYVIAVYQRVQEYSKAGDWENYGRAMKEFDDAMNRLSALRGKRHAQEEFVGPVQETND